MVQALVSFCEATHFASEDCLDRLEMIALSRQTDSSGQRRIGLSVRSNEQSLETFNIIREIVE